jgi:hypothetical protein
VNSKITGCILKRGRDDVSGFDDHFPSKFQDFTKTKLRDELLCEEESTTFLASASHFKDEEDPRRKPFTLDIFKNKEKRTKQYRNIQIASNMHRCCFTCFKYSKECRCGFPRHHAIPEYNNGSSDQGQIIHSRDRKGRMKTQVLPVCNNVNFNPHISSELYVVAEGCNSDAQYVCNKRGAAEYCTSYSLKAEEPDSKALVNYVVKFCEMKQSANDRIETKDYFKAVGNALLHASPIKTTQAIWSLLGLKFVKKSREVLSINTVTMAELDRVIITDEKRLLSMDSKTSVVCRGPNTQIGRRLCYEALVKNQLQLGGRCVVTFFHSSLVSSILHQNKFSKFLCSKFDL